MRPSKRRGANKHKDAKQFRKNAGRTASANMRNNPMRGGWRL